MLCFLYEVILRQCDFRAIFFLNLDLFWRLLLWDQWIWQLRLQYWLSWIIHRNNLRDWHIVSIQRILNYWQCIIAAQLNWVRVDTVNKASNFSINRLMRLEFLGEIFSRDQGWVLKVNLATKPRFPGFSGINHQISILPFFLLHCLKLKIVYTYFWSDQTTVCNLLYHD